MGIQARASFQEPLADSLNLDGGDGTQGRRDRHGESGRARCPDGSAREPWTTPGASPASTPALAGQVIRSQSRSDRTPSKAEHQRRLCCLAASTRPTTSEAETPSASQIKNKVSTGGVNERPMGVLGGGPVAAHDHSSGAGQFGEECVERIS